MNYLYDKETGEKISGVYEKDGTIYKRDYVFYDSILNVGPNGIEVLKFKQPFRVPKPYALDPTMCSNYYTDYAFAESTATQRWKVIDGDVVPVDSSVKITDLIKSRAKSAKESKTKFYNYALGDNDWQYFCTWTFADKRVRADKDLLYDTYNTFIKIIRKRNPGVKALAVYEEFEKGGYHMHALLSNCVLRLTPSINAHNGKFVYSKLGHQVFNCIDWTYGFSDVVCINPDSEKLQVVNYLGSYLTKNCPAPYRCKRFFHTLNLDCRDTYLFNSCDNNEPLLRMIINSKGKLEDGDLTVKAFDEMCDAFELEKVRTSKNGECEVFRSNVDLQGYFDYYPEAFVKKNG